MQKRAQSFTLEKGREKQRLMIEDKESLKEGYKKQKLNAEVKIPHSTQQKTVPTSKS